MLNAIVDIMSILVTGSAGMIGGYVVRGLLEKGHRILGVDLRVNPNLNDNHNCLEQEVLDLSDK